MLLETPCIVVDMTRVRKNISFMQEEANRLGCALRPHIKTHKSVEIARMQLEAGAAGITCAKTSEAEVFADAGIQDIFIAYPLIGESKLQRAFSISKKINRLITAVDCIEGGQAMSAFAIRENTIFETRVEVDTGAKRTGAASDKLRGIGEELRNLPGLRVTGIYTYKSMVHENTATADALAAGAEEGRLLSEAVNTLRDLGFNLRDISAGSTPTGLAVAGTGLVNEIRPGTYVYHDWTTLRQGVCGADEIAAQVWATVISAPSPELAVIDAGVKALAADVRLNTPPVMLPGFACITGRNNLILDRLNEEHGMVRAADGGDTGLQVGNVLALTPAHICTAINLQDFIYAREGEIFRKIKIDARGRTW
jgi:D-serine deaminase-like pyridoxal phosphate-dependent protein